MVIKSIELKDYRNYNEVHIDFDERVNIFFGDNAQGKTNILEAIYLCGTTKSHRGTKDKDIIRFDKEESHIKMIYEKKNRITRVDMHLKKSRSKGIAIDGVPIRRASELVGCTNMVFFSPEDLQIVKDGPAQRRKFIDTELCQLKNYYMSILSNYQKVLESRNHLLRDYDKKPGYDEFIEVLDMQLSQYGKEIIGFRKEFIEMLQPIVRDIHAKLSGDREVLDIVYDPNVLAEEMHTVLKRNRTKDLYLKTTTCGPHRDDIIFMLNGIDVRKFGSQGQQRTVALSLKLAEIELVKKVSKDNPILLLDDVLSELDSNRQNYLLKSISDIQTFITCTGLDEFVKNRFHIDRIFRITNGFVVEKREQ